MPALAGRQATMPGMQQRIRMAAQHMAQPGGRHRLRRRLAHRLGQGGAVPALAQQAHAQFGHRLRRRLVPAPGQAQRLGADQRQGRAQPGGAVLVGRLAWPRPGAGIRGEGQPRRQPGLRPRHGLRRLHITQPAPRLQQAGGLAQPVRPHPAAGLDQPDRQGAGRRLAQREVARRLRAGADLGEAEARAEPRHMLGHLLPARRGLAAVHHQHLEGGVVQGSERLQRVAHRLGRRLVADQVQRHQGQHTRRRPARHRQGRAPRPGTAGIGQQPRLVQQHQAGRPLQQQPEQRLLAARRIEPGGGEQLRQQAEQQGRPAAQRGPIAQRQRGQQPAQRGRRQRPGPEQRPGRAGPRHPPQRRLRQRRQQGQRQRGRRARAGRRGRDRGEPAGRRMSASCLLRGSGLSHTPLLPDRCGRGSTA
ncbi:hypothetical protein [Pseudoroseomonas cervicalis]|uniref:hypothetical protein n=1 Tax=Teichococcus cervicalis TaxID=204525 RepID=UPI0022F1CB25|nr:hypothetical protein [Pseudoroseomonas cervicalis]WBV41464.1 hypothetical protein PFY06_09370 [Pseudoroseomonas cervicalis]